MKKTPRQIYRKAYMAKRLRSPEYKARCAEVNKANRIKKGIWLFEKKAKSVCCMCGDNRPEVLDYHHIDPQSKKATISQAILRNWTYERIEAEIAKCEILCANCHRIKHSKEKLIYKQDLA